MFLKFNWFCRELHATGGNIVILDVSVGGWQYGLNHLSEFRLAPPLATGSSLRSDVTTKDF